MSLYKHKDSSFWWIKVFVSRRTIQLSTGTEDKIKAQEYHIRLKRSYANKKGEGLNLIDLGVKRLSVG